MTVASLRSLMTTGIQSAIQRASHKTGVDFTYLLGQAQVESSLNPTAKAATSSASGLYQFIDQSWLATLKKHGAAHGLGWAADAIGGPGGQHHVADPATRQAVMQLRNDPEIASLMAAEHAADNKAELEQSLGRPVGGTDLYMAHFLGLGGARKFLGVLERNPDAPAASLFPAAAGANRGVFFGEGGRARSVAEVYDRFAAKLQRGAEVAAGGKPLPPVAAPEAPAFRLALAQPQEDDGTSTLDQLLVARAERASLLRPNPDNARLAYMMLASMGA